MGRKYKSQFLKEKEAKHFLTKASDKLNLNLKEIFQTKVNIELIETEFAEIFLINGKPKLAKIGENIFPTLIFEEAFASTPKVVVDMGAVPHVCNGANVMAPGIVGFEGELKKGALLFVVDEKYRKPIAVGELVCDADVAKKVTQGVVLKNIHFVGDEIWNFIKTIKNG